MPRKRGEITVPLQVYIRPDQLAALDDRATSAGASRAELLREMIDKALKLKPR